MNSEPDFEAAIGLIKHLSSDELKGVINDSDKLSELIKDLPQVKNLEREKEMLLVSNKSLADFNLSFESKLSVGKEALLSKYEEISQFQEKLSSINQAIQSSSSKQSPESIQNLLKNAAHEKESEAEKLIEAFLSSQPSVDEFLENYVPGRSDAHSKRIKSEKMAEILRRGEGLSSEAPPYVTTPWATPYPTNLPNMPQPSYNML